MTNYDLMNPKSTTCKKNSTNKTIKYRKQEMKNYHMRKGTSYYHFKTAHYQPKYLFLCNVIYLPLSFYNSLYSLTQILINKFLLSSNTIFNSMASAVQNHNIMSSGLL